MSKKCGLAESQDSAVCTKVQPYKSGSMQSKRGAILLMVLVLVFVVAGAVVLFIERAEVDIKSEGYYMKRADLRIDAWSMLEIAVGVLADVKVIDNDLSSPGQGWGDPLDYAHITPREGLTVRYEFIDESGKANLNSMEEDSLLILFDELGFDLDISLKLRDVLLDWIDEGDETRADGAETREYSSLDLEAHPSNQPLKSLDELQYLFGFKELFFDELGLPLPVFRELENAVTVLDVGNLNVNSASPLALRAIADFDDIDMELINDYLKGVDGQLDTEDDNYFASQEDISSVIVDIPSGAPIGNQISVLTVKVTVEESGYSYTLIGTMQTQSEAPAMEESGGNLNYPFHFIELREEPGANNARPL